MKQVPVLPYPLQEDELHGHLFIHHSVYLTGRDNLAWMLECHEEDHGHPAYLTHPHTHRAPEPEPEDEWSWT